MPAGLQAHTSGVVGREEALYVQFTDEPEGEAASLLSISPKISGSSSLVGATLSFTPEESWAAATNYTVKVKVSGQGDDYVFTFRTPERKVEVVSDGLFIPEGKDATLSVTGSVATNDNASAEEISQLLSASQDGKSLDVVVEAGNDARHFTYTVLGPDRGNDPSPVTIVYDGAKAGFADDKGEITVAIPADDDFRVESMTVTDLGEATLLARFSDRLNSSQNFKGLIKFSTATSFTTKVNGNLLYIYPKADNLGNVQVWLADGIMNTAGYRLGRETSWNVNLGRTEPMLRAVGDGAILPHQGKRLFPFEAIGLSAIRLELVEIYPNNVQ
ncbi:MAG: hypothetical protein AAGA62_18455, partial [Bacteroidota bacterium]